MRMIVEMLLALDENNHQHGGSSARHINNLPQSTVQNGNLEEACAVCLETPTMGDVIRHLLATQVSQRLH
ncbi:hypothetical protein HAX54_043508 [Datura stramonium]|uniref:Uncharacterized protein n=1 Tax=Datura stramonium TaxID=4076 RepID=A0ABS8SNQ4_DATST|nr:hypothetical protein [Datura stramonium]